MIITILCTSSSQRHQWQAELLQYSWSKAAVPGELLRLVATAGDDIVPQTPGCRVVKTLPWDPHPYTQDHYPPYNIPASINEWLFTESVDATLLLLEPESILLSPQLNEVLPGQARANNWKDIPNKGSGPFGLIHAFSNVHTFCVDSTIKLPEIQFPVLIHSSDLRKMTPRWLELTSLIRSSVAHSDAQDAWRVAYAIAAAEFNIAHQAVEMGASINETADTPGILNYRGRIKSKTGKTVWDSNNYTAWEACDPAKGQPGTGRDFLEFLHEYLTFREAGRHLSSLLPVKVVGVREAIVLDQVILDIPDHQEGLSLNSSAAAIWKLIDNNKSMFDISAELESRFDLAAGTLWPDVEATAAHLQSNGAIQIRAKSAMQA